MSEEAHGPGKRKASEITDTIVKVTDARRPFFTIGHSTRSVDEIADLLHDIGGEIIVDVRKMPRSRANPQFNIDVLPVALGGLRGREPALSVSPNTFWRHKSFRNYADYAMTPAFQAGLAELIELGKQRTCTVMCSEVLWWRCHRRIIADYLIADGAAVFHVLGPDNVTPAVLTIGAEKVAAGLLYRERDAGP